jgi:hypothetical protein
MQETYFYVIGVGNAADWQAGSGSPYCVQDRRGDRAVPVFTTPERAWAFARASLYAPEGHVSMLESVPASHVVPSAEARFVVVPLGLREVIEAAADDAVGADYLIRDPGPGTEQDVLMLTRP